MVDTVIADVLAVDSTKSTAIEPTDDPLIDFDAIPEFRQQFSIWKNAKLKEVLAYLHNNWNLKEVNIDRLVMTPQYVFPDRKNRNLYGQVSPGQTFVDPDGNTVLHPETGLPMIFTVWRKVDPPAVDISAEETETSKNFAPAIEGEKPQTQIELESPGAAV